MARSLIISSAAVFFLLVQVAHATTFTVKNNCPFTIWPATLTGGGKAQLSLTGIELGNGAQTSFDVPPQWTGRVWARTRCSTDSGRFSCVTGDCGSGGVACNGAGGAPPATLVEFTVQGSDGMDFYDVSNVDGFNLPVAVAPQGGSGNCSSTACGADINAVCPAELQLKAADGAVVGCKSACVAFNTDQYCCTGAFGSPETCKPTNYSEVFKNACPQAYSYAFDDQTSTFTCTGANYLITFCPIYTQYVLDDASAVLSA